MRSSNSYTLFPSRVDRPLLLIYLVFAGLGLLTIFSSAYTEEHPSLFSMSEEYGKQIMFIGVSILVGVAILLIDGRFLTTYAYHIYGFVMLLCVVVLFMPPIKGAHSWFKIGGFSLQPSEMAKFATALAFAKLLSSPNKKITDNRTRLYAVGLLALPAALITLQPDPGTVLVFISFTLVMYREGMSGVILLLGILLVVIALLVIFFRDSFEFIGFLSSALVITGIAIASGSLMLVGIAQFVRKRYRRKYYVRTIVTTIAVVATCVGTAFAHKYLLKERHRDRIDLALGLKQDKKGIGYNQAQSMAAVASGGFYGKGYQNATLSNDRYNQVPEQTTDFIFCSWGEEWGFIGSVVFILLYLIMLIRMIMIAERQRSQFTRIFGYCTASIFFFHFMINIGMVIGVAPVVGIPLPFFSYGGSSIIGFSILIFILLRLDSERMDVLR